ncbi:hypothetical protein T11_12387 [Trichinella zimbabwensis]|uniref:Uncharacterized protein n=1 Tax=Trichinella zimbabwensis TaxID=268475 RepID=A0A0V1GE25_9BILA|nr:hypothetical protein T11_12387 [Trichinella zimbabwensis]
MQIFMRCLTVCLLSSYSSPEASTIISNNEE